MDKKLAREFVRKVGPLEHSTDPRDRKAARAAEARLRKINASVPKPRGRLGA